MNNRGILNRMGNIGKLPTQSVMETTANKATLNAQRIQEVATMAGFRMMDKLLSPLAKKGSEINSALIAGLLEHLNDYLTELRAINPTPAQVLECIPVNVMEVAKPHARQQMVDIARKNIRLTQEQSVKMEGMLREHLAIVNGIQNPDKLALLDQYEERVYKEAVLSPANERTHPMRVYEQMQAQIARIAYLTGKYNTFAKLQECPELEYITDAGLEWYLVQCKYHGYITSQWNPHKEYHNYRPTKLGLSEYQKYFNNN